MGDVGEGAAVHEGGRALEGLMGVTVGLGMVVGRVRVRVRH